ncbi:hypothetical protein ABE85_21750 [Mitsuaria sp. 7]|nr:hypothetical protein ABE85_21750 [Mitsuaria sp. 7]
MEAAAIAAAAAVRDGKSSDELAQGALHWECTWRIGLMWTAEQLTTAYTPQVREGLRGWAQYLEAMADDLKTQARKGHVTGIEERLRQCDRIWAANQRILQRVVNKEGRPVEQLAADPEQQAMSMFLFNRNAFFKMCKMGWFAQVGLLPQQDRARFIDLMDRLEICSDPAAGHHLLRLLNHHAPQVSRDPLRRF